MWALFVFYYYFHLYLDNFIFKMSKIYGPDLSIYLFTSLIRQSYDFSRVFKFDVMRPTKATNLRESARESHRSCTAFQVRVTTTYISLLQGDFFSCNRCHDNESFTVSIAMHKGRWFFKNIPTSVFYLERCSIVSPTKSLWFDAKEKLNTSVLVGIQDEVVQTGRTDRGVYFG